MAIKTGGVFEWRPSALRSPSVPQQQNVDCHELLRGKVGETVYKFLDRTVKLKGYQELPINPIKFKVSLDLEIIVNGHRTLPESEIKALRIDAALKLARDLRDEATDLGQVKIIEEDERLALLINLKQ
jgi:hypothetical protein